MTDFLYVILTLIITIPLIVIVVYLLKRCLSFQTVNSSDIRIVSQYSVSNKERIIVVKVEEVRLVIGISPQGFNMLHVLNNYDN